MTYLDKKVEKKLEPGDTIIVNGVKATIAKIEFQDIYNGDIHMEFYDTNGVYRSYKSAFDHGTIVRKSEKTINNWKNMNVALEIKKHVIDYFKRELPQYIVLEVVHKSNHPDDDYLFMVAAIHDKGTYAVWTNWNEYARSLNFGHYDISSIEDCRKLFDENFYNVK